MGEPEAAIKKREDTQHGRYLTFSLDKEDYGIEIKRVTEIICMQRINKLPEVPAYIKGVINLRGKIIPVVDVRLRFGKEPLDYADRTCIIVIEGGDSFVGLIVDDVAEVMRINDEQIVPPPDIQGGTKNKFIKAIGRIDDRIKLIIDCEKLLIDDFEETETNNDRAKTIVL